ncbi:hemolysin activation/secretion protein [Janthinobacterium sp. Marseille]|nr:ShlB/FhaC/HecB family hemolysin secretion/activation protein [Janthinobacterium sp. Marseille]ABR89303.1 hemolysin activation/secretion protein [Janthinobacterium sp. Marseille]
MCDVKKNRNEKPMRLKAICLAMLALGLHGAAFAQADNAAAVQATEAADNAPKVDINEYIVRGNSVLDARTIELAVTPYLGPQRTMKDVENARDALLSAYNARGYQSVYVDLPEQQVTGGVVYLQVNETKVGRVRVVGAQYNSPLEVREQVPALQEGKVPDFNLAQAQLTTLNRSAKRQVMPLVKQGALPGTMDVDLKVDDSSPWRASAGLNNDYSADTKKLRATASIGHDNLWQLGHSASMSFFGTPEDLNQTKVWSGSYTAPLRDSNWTLDASGYKSDSTVSTVGGTTVLGKGYAVGFKATYTVPNTGNWWHTMSVGVDFKNNEEALQLGGTGDKVPLKYAPITLGYMGFVQNERSQYSLGLTMIAGTRSLFGYGSDEQAFAYKRYEAKPNFMVLKADLNGSYSFENEAQIGFRLAGQLTDSPLVSGEQIAAGGMNSVRGYLSAETTGDYGVVGSLELRSKPLTYLNPWVENWRVYAFGDASRLKLRDPLVEQQDLFTLASVGFGTSFRLGEQISGRVDVGYPLKAGPRTEKHDTRVNFSVNASY